MTASASPKQTPDKAEPKRALLVPLALVAILLVFLLIALRTGEPQVLPSALIGKPVPEFALAPIPSLQGESGPTPGLSSAAFKTGKVSLLNFWSSTCGPCIIEHPQLTELARQGIPLYSIDYKDKPEAARRFLATHGNPYRAIGADDSGFTAIDFGVYGTPETFVIDGNGQILLRYPGPLTPEVVTSKIMPVIKKAERATGSPRS
jgi:cytochrome c biogenesis protein CcmG, thiol:disulfide interchange protein DsbE